MQEWRRVKVGTPMKYDLSMRSEPSDEVSRSRRELSAQSGQCSIKNLWQSGVSLDEALEI